MSFISYAQNFEDVMLWRALKHVNNGFYIDVGANDPSIDSVTKAFYERGWHGINIEPLPSHHTDLVRDRPRDINLQVAAGASHGEVEVWECDVRGWATAADGVIAMHEAAGHKGVTHKVPLLTLAEICKQYASNEIHFLKIDVEGFEEAVLLGMDFSCFRPWVLVIEATKPNTQEENYQNWEPIVLAARYVFAYTDGLNRFYVSLEHDKLQEFLRYPPNVFDGFIRVEQLNSELRAQQTEARAEQTVAESRAQIVEAQAQQAAAEHRAELAEARAEQTIAESRAQIVEAQAQQAAAEHRAELAEARAQQTAAESRALIVEAQAELAAVRKELNDTHQLNQLHWTQLEASRKELEQIHQANHQHWLLAEQRSKEVEALRASLSWQITAPLRWLAAPVMRRGSASTVAPAPTFIDKAIRWGMAQPRLVAFVHRRVQGYPKLRAVLTRRVSTAMRHGFAYGMRSENELSQPDVTAIKIPVVFNTGSNKPLGFLNSSPQQSLAVEEILQNIRAELAALKRDT